MRTATHRFGCTTASIEDKLGLENIALRKNFTGSEVSAKRKIITCFCFFLCGGGVQLLNTISRNLKNIVLLPGVGWCWNRSNMFNEHLLHLRCLSHRTWLLLPQSLETQSIMFSSWRPEVCYWFFMISSHVVATNYKH